jgi:thioredoxin-related protein
MPFILEAQENKGIQFEELTNWQQVLTKAKTENKFIFVDMVATWCAPCKMMDKFTYPKNEVGEALKNGFISIKIQIDSTKKDNDLVKSWYRDAGSLVKEYNVTALPTFLFFSPDGKIVHRGTGMKNPEQLIALAKEATDPSKQLYTVLEKYRRGEKQDFSKLPELSQVAKAAGADELAKQIVNEYFNNYLYKKEPGALTVKEIYFLASNLQNSKEKGFTWFRNPKSAGILNKIVLKDFGPNYSEKVSDAIIFREEVVPRIPKDADGVMKESDWAAMRENIKKKYDSKTADRLVLNTQQYWFYTKKQWTAFSKTIFRKMEKFGMDTTLLGRAYTNNSLFEIFMNVSDPSILTEAAKWQEKIVKMDQADSRVSGYASANSIDTYANLLYRAGETKKAIEWQQKAVKLDEEFAQQNKAEPRDVFRKTLEKMQSGQPTWTNDK